MRIRKVIRDIPAGAAEDAIDIDVILKADSSTIDTVTTNTDGIGTYEQDGNPGPLLMEATIGSQTKRYDTQAEPALGLLTPIDLTIALRALGTGYLPGYTDPQTTDGGMAVSPGTGLQVLVAEGAVLIDGSVYRCTSSTALTVAANATGSTRYDYVVVRLTREGDDEEGKCELVVKTGTSGVNDAGPEITSTVYEYGLARITVANGASGLVAGNIADIRYNLTFNQSPALRWPSGDNHPQAGDLFYINSAGVLTRLPKSDIGMFLYLNAFSVPDWTSTITAKNFRSDSPTFNPTAGAAAGTGGAVNAARLRGGDRCGEISVLTGSSGTAAGVLATIEFGVDQPDTNYLVFLTPSSINAADLNLSVSSKAVGSFEIRANVAPGTGETLNIQFLVMQVA